MTKEELEKIYRELDSIAAQLLVLADRIAALRAELASGGGPGPK